MNADFRRTRWRIVAWSVAVVTMILLATGTIVYAVATRALMQSVDATLVASSATAQTELSEAEQSELEQPGFRAGLFYLVLQPDGTVVSNPQAVGLAQVPDAVLGTDSPGFTTTEINGDSVRMYARRIDGEILVVGESLVPEQDASRQLLTVLLLGGGIGVLLSVCGGWLLAARSLIPIQRAFNRQQAFVADASHELRTPLTILHSTADLLEQQIDRPTPQNRMLVDELRQEIIRMERLTRDLLTLARSDRGEMVLSLGRVDLRALAHDLKGRVAVLANARGIDITVRSTEVAPVVEADPDRLQQVGLIVIDNALNHTPRGGQVTLAVGLRQDAGFGVLEVEDTGEGIPSEHLDRVFERFHRVDTSRSRTRGGSGLGLAIAHTLVVAHGGQIHISNRPVAGARVTIEIPLAPPEPDLLDLPTDVAEQSEQAVGGDR